MPFYRQRLAEAPPSESGTNIREYLQRLPVLEKNEVQAKWSEFRSELYADKNAVEVIRSSGTSGKAIDICVDLNYFKLEKPTFGCNAVGVG